MSLPKTPSRNGNKTDRVQESVERRPCLERGDRIDRCTRATVHSQRCKR